MFRPPETKIVEWSVLLEWRAAALGRRQIVVWTNGCFDLLHVGHVRSLQAARRRGDTLVVGLNSDSSVRALKGPGRPLVASSDRAEMLAALECVDFVIEFDELTPARALDRLRPEIHCKGMDYAPPDGKPIPELAVVESYGGRVEFLSMTPDVSTSQIVRRILQP